jgi:hypothetical protein
VTPRDAQHATSKQRHGRPSRQRLFAGGCSGQADVGWRATAHGTRARSSARTHKAGEPWEGRLLLLLLLLLLLQLLLPLLLLLLLLLLLHSVRSNAGPSTSRSRTPMMLWCSVGSHAPAAVATGAAATGGASGRTRPAARP